MAKLALKCPHKTRGACILLTLNVKILTFARWTDILEALQNFQVPLYLSRVIDSYVCDRELIYDTEEGLRISSNVAQRSAFSPDLRNIIYDDILRLQLPEGVKLVDCRSWDAKLHEQAQCSCTLRISAVRNWLFVLGLDLAANNRELVVLTRHQQF